MKIDQKRVIAIFFFHFLVMLGLNYLMRKNRWEWASELTVALIYSLLMTLFYHEQMKNKELYLTTGNREELRIHLKSLGFIEKKQKDNSTYFKKPGFKLNPFKYTEVKESPFYTKITTTVDVMESIPEHLERIRQPYNAN